MNSMRECPSPTNPSHILSSITRNARIPLRHAGPRGSLCCCSRPLYTHHVRPYSSFDLAMKADPGPCLASASSLMRVHSLPATTTCVPTGPMALVLEYQPARAMGSPSLASVIHSGDDGVLGPIFLLFCCSKVTSDVVPRPRVELELLLNLP
jgi:hypothetical protein